MDTMCVREREALRESGVPIVENGGEAGRMDSPAPGYGIVVVEIDGVVDAPGRQGAPPGDGRVAASGVGSRCHP